MKSDETDWSRLFPEEDFGFRFGFRRGEPSAFFGRDEADDSVVRERNLWLDRAADRHSAVMTGGKEILGECLRLAVEWGTLSGSPPDGDVLSRCRWLGRRWAPDYLLLQAVGAEMRLVGGCVCFPSSWRLSEKLGRPLTDIHARVPGLNEGMQMQINRALRNLKPGSAVLRSNLGLSASAERNQDPDRCLPRLQSPVKAEEVHLRIEHQALVALPETGGVLFGIRLEILPLSGMLHHAEAVRGLARALRTMPDGVAEYKGLAAVRGELATLCERAGVGD